MLVMIPSTLRAACVDETLECKNQQIAELNARIEALEIENAELKYDVSELKPKTRALKKELNQCKVNLKNVRSVCGRVVTSEHITQSGLTTHHEQVIAMQLFDRRAFAIEQLLILTLLVAAQVNLRYALADQFVGQANFVTNDDFEHSQQIKLISPLYFVDKNQKRWTARADQYLPKHLISDEVRYMVPLPSDFDYIKTASIYLSQSIVAENEWTETIEILFPALITEGMHEHLAKMIFAVVYAEGWRWEKLVEVDVIQCVTRAPRCSDGARFQTTKRLKKQFSGYFTTSRLWQRSKIR